MIAGEKEHTPTNQSAGQKLFTWLKLGLSLAFIGWGVWYVTREITLAEVARALSLADVGYIGIALLVIVITIATKAWRWQLLFYPRAEAPAFSSLFWAVCLGQFINTTVPFLRLGDLARIYALHQQTGMGRIRSLSTIILEKTLDTIMLVLTLAVLLPLVVVPDFLMARSLTLGTAALGIFIVLYLLAYQTEFVIRILRRLANYLPAVLARRFVQLAVASLEGVAALRDPRMAAALLGVSILIAILSVLTPLILFPAMHLPLGPIEASLIHIVTIAASAIPAPTPARIGVFEFAVVFMLNRFGITNEALALSYAILFHLVVILPQIVLGAVAASQTRWRWRVVRTWGVGHAESG